jgi:hypothetical protein
MPMYTPGTARRVKPARDLKPTLNHGLGRRTAVVKNYRFIDKMARPERFELPTLWFEAVKSNKPEC